MPTYIRPKLAHVERGGADWGGLVLIGTGVVAAAAVLAFVLAHLVLLAVCLGVFVVVMGGLVIAMRVAVSGRADIPEIAAHPVPPGAVRRAILAPPRAIAPPAQHLHFHGVAAEEVAAIIRRQDTPGRQAIQEDPCSPS